MESDQGKLFIGGISWETTEEKLQEHFSTFGDVSQAAVMRDKLTGRPRGFGFVVYTDPASVDAALLEPHTLDGRTVDVKRALSREEQQASKAVNPSAGRNAGGGGGGGGGGDASGARTKKIFVGGLPSSLTDEEFRQYFQTFGSVTDVVVMYDQTTQRPRGFGFITFDSEDAVDRVLHKTFHDLGGKMVEVKRALPREANPGSGGGGRSMGGGGFHSNNGPNSNTSSYDGRGDAGRYAQAQQGSGGYPGYGAAGYGTAPTGYGYGHANPGTTYGNYGSAGYGGVPSAYATGAYGNPSSAASGYQGGPPGANRGPWGTQAPSGYGTGGYAGNAGYGAWNSSSAAGNAPTSHSQAPGAAAGYGNQGYGYGGYGGDASYGNPGGYGAYGGRGDGAGNPATGAAPGYGAGYGSANGNSGYPNAWTDPSQGGGFGGSVNGASEGQSNYGGGYGGMQPRVAQ